MQLHDHMNGNYGGELPKGNNSIIIPESDALPLGEDIIINAYFVGLGTAILSSGLMKPLFKHFLATCGLFP